MPSFPVLASRAAGARASAPLAIRAVSSVATRRSHGRSARPRAVPRPDVFTRSPPRPRPPRPVPGASARHPPHAKTEQAPLKPSLELINLASSPRALPRPTPTHRPSRRARSVGPASAVLLIYSSTIHAPIVRLSYSNVQKECDGAAARASRLKGRRELSAPVDRGHYRCTPPVYASRSHRNPRR